MSTTNMSDSAPAAAAPSAVPFGPVSGSERISTIDVARGFALLGILLMNVVAFGLPFSAYFNPTVAGGVTGWNLAAWVTQAVLFDGKMRGLFSMLFGAGVIIFTSRGERRGAGISTADFYYRRTLWLLLFGVWTLTCSGGATSSIPTRSADWCCFRCACCVPRPC